MASKLYMGSDHAGFTFKKQLLNRLKEKYPSLQIVDLGCDNETSCDYPVYARKVGEAVAKEAGLGILVCGSGIGVAIAANKVAGIRAATITDVTQAHLCREHNNANVICFGARLTGPDVAFEAACRWLDSEFLGGRHQNRVQLITDMETK